MHVSSDLYVPCRLTVIRTSFVHGAFDGAPELASGCKTLASKASRQSARVPHSWSCEAGGSKNYISARRLITAVEHQLLSLSKRVREDPYTNCSCTKQKARGAARSAGTHDY